MADIGGFWGAVVGAGGTIAVLLGIARFGGRSLLTHWLSKDIERIKGDFQKELAAENAKHSNALEGYRASLVKETERTRAEQAVKTAVAVKFSEHRFTALSELNSAISGVASLICSNYELAIYCRDFKHGLWQQFDIQNTVGGEKLNVLARAIGLCSLHLSPEDVQSLLNFQAIMMGVSSVSLEMRAHSLTGKLVKIVELEHLKQFLNIPDALSRIKYLNAQEGKVLEVIRRNAKNYLEMHETVAEKH